MPAPKIHRCQCGCGEEVGVWTESSPANNRVKGEPKRFKQGHAGRRPIGDRFWEKVNKDAPNGCWEWTGSLRFGYGQFNIGKPQMAYSHRYSYELVHGSIPEGFHVHHRCENKLCVNPEHLEALSAKEHRQTHRPTHCPQGHEYTPENTLWDAGHRRCRECKRQRGRDAYRRKKLGDGDV